MVAGSLRDPRGRRSPLHHIESVVTSQGTVGQRPGPTDGGAKEGALLVASDADGLDVGIKIAFGVMVGRDLVEVPALLVKPEPPSLSVLVVAFDVHRDDGPDAGEREDHHADEGPVPESDDARRV